MKDYFGVSLFNELLEKGLKREDAMQVHQIVLQRTEEAGLDMEFLTSYLLEQMLKEGKKNKKIEVGVI